MSSASTCSQQAELAYLKLTNSKWEYLQLDYPVKIRFLCIMPETLIVNYIVFNLSTTMLIYLFDGELPTLGVWLKLDCQLSIR